MKDRNENTCKYERKNAGCIPAGWSKAKLGQVIVHLSSGISRPFSSQNIGVPVLRSNNVMDGRIILDEIKYWFTEDPRGAKLDNVRPVAGDVLVNFVNGSRKELGKAAVFRGLPQNCIVSTNLFILRPDHSKVSTNFLGYHFASHQYKEWLYRVCGYSGQGSFNQYELKSHELVSIRKAPFLEGEMFSSHGKLAT
jgi:type I restriction enzyme S subunit